MKYHELMDAADLGDNVVTAGHFYTENMVCEKLSELVGELAPTVRTEITYSNRIVSL
jgi:putative NIF3 family GTP cyclohydrolase 1 type 2